MSKPKLKTSFYLSAAPKLDCLQEAATSVNKTPKFVAVLELIAWQTCSGRSVKSFRKE